MPRHREILAPLHRARGREVISLDWTYAHHERGRHIWGVKNAWDPVHKRQVRVRLSTNRQPDEQELDIQGERGPDQDDSRHPGSDQGDSAHLRGGREHRKAHEMRLNETQSHVSGRDAIGDANRDGPCPQRQHGEKALGESQA